MKIHVHFEIFQDKKAIDVLADKYATLRCRIDSSQANKVWQRDASRMSDSLVLFYHKSNVYNETMCLEDHPHAN